MWPRNRSRVTESGMNGYISMSTMITQNLTFIIFTVPEKIAILKFLPQTNTQLSGLILIITLTHIFPASQKLSEIWSTGTQQRQVCLHSDQALKFLLHSALLWMDPLHLGQQYTRMQANVNNKSSVKQNIQGCSIIKWLFTHKNEEKALGNYSFQLGLNCTYNSWYAKLNKSSSLCTEHW